jgi:hypothetical protein
VENNGCRLNTVLYRHHHRDFHTHRLLGLSVEVNAPSPSFRTGVVMADVGYQGYLVCSASTPLHQSKMLLWSLILSVDYLGNRNVVAWL